jgi:hypothetical protein
MTSTNNAQLLGTINKNTVLGGPTKLSSVDYNGNSVSSVSTVLSSFLYTQNVIEFKSLSSNTVVFHFSAMPIHQKILVRAKVFT